ncbi:Apc15p protein-domain-containing protein [Ampelomyces quisqualis]|uniref:Apc15p protein-domain-containing protein n=1 Tax=Ampelomyces quisqualis TaxID=50730 RepID=A0A6A5QR09_AMPQU|nr:Apc15p protein-domain-containing protein [Ampelomyces quisqualis]
MLSLPMVPPRADASLWPSHRMTHNHPEDPSNSPPNSTSQRRPTSHHGHPHSHHHARSSTSALLASLTQDENTIEQRKLNVRRFGAGWIRPPGVAKTLQATDDEQLEREEQEMMQRREQIMLDLAAAQQDAANAEAREDGEEGEEAMDDQRDLDDEVPEAMASESSIDSSDDDAGSSSAQGENDTTVPFNEDSFLEGSMLEAEVSHMLEMEEAEMAGVLQDERDLDDDVPEAGSYEHTDSELEDDSDGDDMSTRLPGLNSVRSRPSRRSSGLRRISGQHRRSSGLPSAMAPQQHMTLPAAAGTLRAGNTTGRGLDLGVDLGQGRSSFGMDGSSSIMEGSSFLRSSPAAAASRGNLRDRFLGAVRGGRNR